MSRDIREEMRDLRNFVTAGCSGLEARVQTDSAKTGDISILEDFSAFKDIVFKRLTELERRIDNLDDHLDNLEAYSRKNCLIVHGIKEENNEAVESVVCNFFKEHFRINIDAGAFDNLHRLGRNKSSNKHPRPIIVKFLSYLVRKKIWSNKRVLKGTGFLISESLTKRRSAAYKLAKQLFGVSRTWTQDSRICVLGRDGRKRFFTSTDELHRAAKTLLAISADQKDQNRNLSAKELPDRIVQVECSETGGSDVASDGGKGPYNTRGTKKCSRS